MSSRPSAKYCAVRKCSNSSVKTAHKFFFSSPENLIRRKRWLDAMGLSYMHYSVKTRFFVCEDHFDLPNDLQNYGKFVHGKSIFKQHKLKLDVVPHISSNQKNKNFGKESPAQTASSRRVRKSSIEDVSNPLEEKSLQTEPNFLEEKSLQTDLTIKSEKEDMGTEEEYLSNALSIKSENSDAETNSFFQITLRCDGDITCTCDTGLCDRIETHDKGSQCFFNPVKPKIRSRGTQTLNRYYVRDVALSPIRFDDIEDEKPDV